jgi:hypothetical protein
MVVYQPYVIDVYQSKYGYWIVVLSVTPWLRMSVMVARLGLTSNDAAGLVAGAYQPATSRKQAT